MEKQHVYFRPCEYFMSQLTFDWNGYAIKYREGEEE